MSTHIPAPGRAFLGHPARVPFECAPPTHIELALADEHGPFLLYRVGPVDGQWRETPDAYEILSFHAPEASRGGGHLNEVLAWFAFSSAMSGKPVRVRCLTNRRLYARLRRMGFALVGDSDGHPDVERAFDWPALADLCAVESRATAPETVGAVPASRTLRPGPFLREPRRSSVADGVLTTATA